MEKKSSLRYVAGACFALDAILIIINLVQNKSFSAWSLLTIAGAVLIAVAMFASVPMLIAVGGGVSAISSASTVISCLRADIYSWRYSYTSPIPIWVLIAQILLLAVWVLIIVVGLNTKNGKTLGMVAGALAALRFLILIFGNKIGYGTFGLTFRSLLIYLVIIVGAFMTGLAFVDNSPKPNELTNTNANGSANASAAESQIDRLTKLKGFLDSGLITQEEFDAKKKQILGL